MMLRENNEFVFVNAGYRAMRWEMGRMSGCF